MSKPSVEDRLAIIEAELATLKTALTEKESLDGFWWDRIRGRFKNDPAYEEAMRFGREYRESLKPTNHKNDAA